MRIGAGVLTQLAIFAHQLHRSSAIDFPSCPTGHYSGSHPPPGAGDWAAALGDSRTCEPCAAGRHDHDRSSDTACLECPEGRFAAETASHVCNVCSPETYALPGSAQCQQLPLCALSTTSLSEGLVTPSGVGSYVEVHNSGALCALASYSIIINADTTVILDTAIAAGGWKVVSLTALVPGRVQLCDPTGTCVAVDVENSARRLAKCFENTASCDW